jgi:D-alanyl-lipoteichoic acid acyltransferase DltB (MBOAT superfamily)
MFLLGLTLFATLFCGLHLLSSVSLLQRSFLLDHCLKVLLFVAVVESMSLAITSGERLGGFETTPITRRILLSRSVAEFWLRYNTRMHDWLYQNVFQPGGGRRAPVRAVLLTFFVSGLFHEWIFGISTSRFDGYQFAFFMLQAPACLLSPKLQRLARRPSVAGKVIAHVATIVWFTATSTLFFHGVDRVFDFTYAAEPWLP